MGLKCTLAADVYSLGILLVELTTQVWQLRELAQSSFARLQQRRDAFVPSGFYPSGALEARFVIARLAASPGLDCWGASL
jgi:hypothetical protein